MIELVDGHIPVIACIGNANRAFQIAAGSNFNNRQTEMLFMTVTKPAALGTWHRTVSGEFKRLQSGFDGPLCLEIKGEVGMNQFFVAAVVRAEFVEIDLVVIGYYFGRNDFTTFAAD
jgi:hypothetical protein